MSTTVSAWTNGRRKSNTVRQQARVARARRKSSILRQEVAERARRAGGFFPGKEAPTGAGGGGGAEHDHSQSMDDMIESHSARVDAPQSPAKASRVIPAIVAPPPDPPSVVPRGRGDGDGDEDHKTAPGTDMVATRALSDPRKRGGSRQGESTLDLDVVLDKPKTCCFCFRTLNPKRDHAILGKWDFYLFFLLIFTALVTPCVDACVVGLIVYRCRVAIVAVRAAWILLCVTRVCARLVPFHKRRSLHSVCA
jgi:hypothetical protein